MFTENIWLAKALFNKEDCQLKVGILKDFMHPVIYREVSLLRNEYTLLYPDRLSYLGHSWAVHTTNKSNMIHIKDTISIKVVNCTKNFGWEKVNKFIESNDILVCEFKRLKTFEHAISTLNKISDEYKYSTSIPSNRFDDIRSEAKTTFAIVFYNINLVSPIYDESKVDGIGMSIFILDKERTSNQKFPSICWQQYSIFSNHLENIFKIDGVDLRVPTKFTVDKVMHRLSLLFDKDIKTHSDKSRNLAEKYGSAYRDLPKSMFGLSKRPIKLDVKKLNTKYRDSKSNNHYTKSYEVPYIGEFPNMVKVKVGFEHTNLLKDTSEMNTKNINAETVSSFSEAEKLDNLVVEHTTKN